MNATAAVSLPSRRRFGFRELRWLAATVFFSMVCAVLIAKGHWYVAVAMLAAVPMFVWLHRAPLAGVAIWLVCTPLIVETSSTALRQAFWLLHRALPLGLLLILVAGAATGVSQRRLARLGWPEVLFAGYAVASLFSILDASPTVGAQVILMYDRVVAPLCIYLVIRLLEPDAEALRRLTPVVLALFVIEAPLGLVSLVAPGALPSLWLVSAQRATGSFGDPDVFGTTMVFCGVFILWAGMTSSRGRWVRVWAGAVFVLAMLMVFLTFSRGNWLAGLFVLAGSLVIYRRRIASLVAITVPIAALLLASGLLHGPIQFAQERLSSDASKESALARLPVAVASIRMFEAKPVTGFGYGNFDLYSRPFQDQVGDLVIPIKDHASHNLFLTILAEQGGVGIALFLGPMVLWAIRTRRSYVRMPAAERRLLVGLWLVIASYLTVNMFSVMKVPFGLGLWAVTLGMIGALIHRYGPGPAQREDAAAGAGLPWEAW
ncbi:MAG: O-antigen ligase family protein [Planctomycetaceae bacterium]